MLNIEGKGNFIIRNSLSDIRYSKQGELMVSGVSKQMPGVSKQMPEDRKQIVKTGR
jgi:hypothetical protein